MTGLLLLALQTTAAATDDDRLDAITLVLVVVFIVAMAALSLLLRRRESGHMDELPPQESRTSGPIQAPPARNDPPRREQPWTTPRETTPVWLQGITVPAKNIGLAEATGAIEALLAARRDHDLAGGLRLCTPGLRGAIATRFGVDESDLMSILDAAIVEGEPPSLRSVELLSATANYMTVRSSYSNGTAETYRLIHLDNRWLIESIDQI